MISLFALTSAHRFLLYPGITDFRIGFDGLSGIVRNELNRDPASGRYLYLSTGVVTASNYCNGRTVVLYYTTSVWRRGLLSCHYLMMAMRLAGSVGRIW